jgi:Uri superfamily endonuclease
MPGLFFEKNLCILLEERMNVCEDGCSDWKHEKSHLFTSALRPVLQFAKFFPGPNFDLI